MQRKGVAVAAMVGVVVGERVALDDAVSVGDCDRDAVSDEV